MHGSAWLVALCTVQYVSGFAWSPSGVHFPAQLRAGQHFLPHGLRSQGRSPLHVEASSATIGTAAGLHVSVSLCVCVYVCGRVFEGEKGT